MILQYISIFLGVAIVVYLMIKSWNPIVMGVLATTVVAVLNGLPVGDTILESFFGGFAGMVKSLLPPLFSGCLLCQTYTRSGAVVTIADTLIDLLYKKEIKENRPGRYVPAILAMVIVTGVISYCGINSLVVLIATYPIALRVMERAGIPKRYVIGILSGGVYTFALSAPGTTETVNILAMQVVGTPSYAGLVGGLVACITEVAVITVILSKSITTSVANGEVFAYGPKDMDFSAMGDKKRPGMLISTLPLLVLVGLFNLFSVNIFIATMIGWLLSVLLFWPYMNGKEEFIEACHAGAKASFDPVSAVGSLVGVTTVLQSLPAFQVLMDSVFELSLPAPVILILAVSFIAALTGSSTAAVRVAIPMVIDKCRAAGLTDAFIHRVSAFACTTIDTVPWAAAVMINLTISDQKMKDAYPPMFVSTCLATMCGTLICALVMYIFPNLP